MAVSSNPLTLTYKIVDKLRLQIDVYPPVVPHERKISAVVYFHGGGLTVGDRKSWFPAWLQRRLCNAGVAFISADYRLLVPSTGHDILQDIKDLFIFLEHGLNQAVHETLSPLNLPSFLIDPQSIAVSGTSAGGLCAYLSAMHASPKPVALVSMYGMGADFLTDHYLQPKTKPFFRGREILNPSDFQEYLLPNSSQLSPIAESPLVYHPKHSPTPGFPANPRMLLTRLYLQQGNFLDYYTGAYNISELLRSNPTRALIPSNHIPLFPQFGVTTSWPPTLIVHGTADTAVPIQESRDLRDLLEAASVDVSLVAVEGKEHSFDYDSSAEVLHKELFDQVAEVLVARLGFVSHE